VAVERSFDPRATTRTFTIASTDAELIVDLPEIARLVAERMPQATLRAVSVDYLLSTDGLTSGTVDLVLGYARGMDPTWHSHPLYVERPALVVRRDHPTLGARIGRKEFESHRHIDVHVQLGSPGAGNQDARKALDGQQLRREVRLIVPGFTAAALAATRTDYIAGIPRRLAETFCRYLPLRIVEMAGFDFAFPATLCWHERTHLDPAVAYLRSLVIEALSSDPSASPKARGGRRAKTSRTSERRRAAPTA
jgi:DNA-binding transcriptional LysR family regulator